MEIKGYCGEDAVQKKATMEQCWIPGVNSNGNFGRWAFLEIRDYYAIGSDLYKFIARARAANGLHDFGPAGLMAPDKSLPSQ